MSPHHLQTAQKIILFVKIDSNCEAHTFRMLGKRKTFPQLKEGKRRMKQFFIEVEPLYIFQTLEKTRG